VLISVQVSAGYATNSDGSRAPIYTTVCGVSAQVQQLTGEDLRHLEALNIQGSTRKLYVNGSIDAIVRFAQKGGDIVTLLDGTVYLTTHVLERWPDWCAVAMQLQNVIPSKAGER
jgi:hypothetical protein